MRALVVRLPYRDATAAGMDYPRLVTKRDTAGKRDSADRYLYTPFYIRSARNNRASSTWQGSAGFPAPRGAASPAMGQSLSGVNVAWSPAGRRIECGGQAAEQGRRRLGTALFDARCTRSRHRSCLHGQRGPATVRPRAVGAVRAVRARAVGGGGVSHSFTIWIQEIFYLSE